METGTTNNTYIHKLILVYYIDVRNISVDDMQIYVRKIMNKISLESPDIGEIIALPIMGETKVECINPKYITEPELIREHRLKMDGLHEVINNFIEKNKIDDGK